MGACAPRSSPTCTSAAPSARTCCATPRSAALLLEEIAGADRLVLLGDVARAARTAAARGARGGAARSSRSSARRWPAARSCSSPATTTTASPSRCSKSWRWRRRRALGLEQRDAAREEAGGRRSPAGSATPSSTIAYPGIWLRDDVYATHGHYMDCHMSLPRVECVAAAAVMRAFGPVPDPAAPADYERVLRPVYGFSYGLAQSDLALRRRPAPRSAPGATISGRDRRGGRAAARGDRGPRSAAGVPATVWTLNRLLRADFDPDLSAAAITRSGIDGGDRAGAPARPRRRPRDHRPHPPRRPATRARPRGRWPAAAASTTPAAGSSPPPSTTPAPRRAPTGRGRSPGSRTTGRRGGSACSTSTPARRCGRSSGAASAALTPRGLVAHAEPLGDDRADLLAGVLLEEVAGVLDHPRRRVVEPLGDLFADRERQRRVGVGPEDQRRPLVLAQRVGDPPALRRARRVGLGRQDQREGAGAGLRLGARDRAPRRRRSPRRRGPPCSRP